MRKKELKSLRKAVIAFARAVCNLPGRSSVSYFFSGKSDGGLGLLDPKKEPDVLTLVQATKMLVSKDAAVAGKAACGAEFWDKSLIWATYVQLSICKYALLSLFSFV